MVDKTTITTVLDGVQQIATQKQIKLCIRHVVPDTSPPPPHSLDLSFTTQTILYRLQRDEDPLDLLPTDAADTLDQTLSLSSYLPPPPAEKQLRYRNKRRTSHADTIHEKNAKVLQLVNSGTPTSDVIKASSLPKSTFYKWKVVAEMKIIDVDQFNHFQENNNNKDATELLKVCKVTLMEELFVGIAKDLKKISDLL